MSIDEMIARLRKPPTSQVSRIMQDLQFDRQCNKGQDLFVTRKVGADLPSLRNHDPCFDRVYRVIHHRRCSKQSY